MKKFIKNTILAAVTVFLGLSLVGCKKDNLEPQLEPRVDHSISVRAEARVTAYKYSVGDTIYVDMEVYGEKFTKVLHKKGFVNTTLTFSVGHSMILEGKQFDESKIAPVKISIRSNSDKGVSLIGSSVKYEIMVTKSDYDPKRDFYHNVEREVRFLELQFRNWDSPYTGDYISSEYEVIDDYTLNSKKDLP